MASRKLQDHQVEIQRLGSHNESQPDAENEVDFDVASRADATRNDQVRPRKVAAVQQ